MAIEQQSTNVPIEDKELSKEDVIDLLNDESDEEVVDDDKVAPETTVDDEEEPVIEEDKDKIKLIEEDVDELDDPEEIKKDFVLTPAKRAEILKQFPDFFKKFPEMEKSYYRDRAFSEVFATPDEAKEAQARAETLSTFEQQLSQGNIKGVLEEVKKNNGKAFSHIADDYLKALGEVDPQAQVHVTSGIVKGLIISLVNEAKVQNNDELRKIALAVNQFCFGTSQFQAHSSLAGPQEPQQVTDERVQFLQERYEITVSDLDRKVSNVLKSTISEYVDPKGLMTDWAKKNAVGEALTATFSSLQNDPTFKNQLNKLWGQAAQRKFDHQSVNAIRKAYLSKAQTVLPKHIKTARNNALKGLGKRVKEEKPEAEDRIQKSRQSSSSTNRGQESGKGKTTHRGSTLDFLNQE